MADVEAYRQDGFAVFRSPAVRELKDRLTSALAARALAALDREPRFKNDVPSLRSLTLSEIIDHVVARESGNEVSGRLFRTLATVPEFLAAVADPTVLEWIATLGVTAPLAGTTPMLRIDRPGDEVHRTPAHQDWWFSLLSPNCVTAWFPMGPLTPDMGLLEVVPGSHRGGLIPFGPNDNRNPFRALGNHTDSDYRGIPLAEDQVLIFSQYLLHRSGFNHSQRTRLSVQLRYNDIATMERAESSYTVQHSDWVVKEQARLLIDK